MALFSWYKDSSQKRNSLASPLKQIDKTVIASAMWPTAKVEKPQPLVIKSVVKKQADTIELTPDTGVFKSIT